MTEAPRYTLDEARAELQRVQCAAGGHRPSIEIADYGDSLSVWFCDCGQYLYEPKARP